MKVASMLGLSCEAVNAPIGPDRRLNGIAAATMSACNLRSSGVTFATDAGDPQGATGGNVVGV